ncbi:hypothetical protein [Sagittula sp. SSi028]|uniref:hypothetical protein n=1 Tax=Sagittula sp. SSi028 TaxID=3400636 RepID=UPI003AF75191
MKAIGYTQAGPVDGEGALVAFEATRPDLGPQDVLVAVKGVSVNPVDTKLRAVRAPAGGHGILGF